MEPWASRIQEVAKYENVCCKISGMVGEADWKDWKEEDFFPYMETIYNAFGPGRLMVGSDWPVCRLAGEYPEVIKIVENFVPEDDKEQIFWKNAVEFYGLDV